MMTPSPVLERGRVGITPKEIASEILLFTYHQYSAKKKEDHFRAHHHSSWTRVCRLDWQPRWYPGTSFEDHFRIRFVYE